MQQQLNIENKNNDKNKTTNQQPTLNKKNYDKNKMKTEKEKQNDRKVYGIMKVTKNNF